MCFAPLGLRCSMWDCQSSQWYARSFYFYVDLFTSLYWVATILFLCFFGGGHKACGILAPLPRTKLGREVMNFVSILLSLRHLWQWDEATQKKAGGTLGTWALESWEEEEDPTKESRKDQAMGRRLRRQQCLGLQDISGIKWYIVERSSKKEADKPLSLLRVVSVQWWDGSQAEASLSYN